jgi:hypothetical protein
MNRSFAAAWLFAGANILATTLVVVTALLAAPAFANGGF